MLKFETACGVDERKGSRLLGMSSIIRDTNYNRREKGVLCGKEVNTLSVQFDDNTIHQPRITTLLRPSISTLRLHISCAFTDISSSLIFRATVTLSHHLPNRFRRRCELHRVVVLLKISVHYIASRDTIECHCGL